MNADMGRREDAAGAAGNSSQYGPVFHDFHDLMKFRVTEILLVSSLYDAFILEEEGLLSDQISGYYKDMDLSSPPRVVRVESCEEALAELSQGHYDMIVTMPRLVDMDPFEFGRRAKEIQEGIPVILLLTDSGDIPEFYNPGQRRFIDKVFLWGGDSSLFVAITKFVEDMINAGPDTAKGYVQVLMLVEDSPRYYSMFLPILYREVLEQTHALISEGVNEHEKLFRKRSRPRILLAETYEEAMDIFREHGEHLLGIITDVDFPVGGEKVEGAGFRLVDEIDRGIPALVQSSQGRYEEMARERGLTFLEKGSDTLLQDLRAFLKMELGFGDFVFRNARGEEIGRASDLGEFVQLMETIPAESIIYHASANHFSNWLMARGEVELAMRIRPRKVGDFANAEEIRRHLIGAVRASDIARRRGVITDFYQQDFGFGGTFTRLGTGSLGGKGRGLAFLFSLFSRRNVDSMFRGCRVLIPDTLVIATDMFDRFMEENGLRGKLNGDMSDRKIKELFLGGNMPDELMHAVRKYAGHVKVPIAIRSSSLLEDSHNQPFAGIYSTYMLPNVCPDDEERVKQICDAIKLVYASAFFRQARAYIQATVHTSEEEKMGVVIQKLVGNRYGDRFYPVFSGVAQSHNFYPVGPLRREEGIISAALGLGKIVVEGGNVISFSPSRPNVIPGFSSPEEIMANSQSYFYALSMSDACYDLARGEDVTLLKLPVSEADEEALRYLASTYDADDHRLRDGIDGDGPRYITFAGVLKYGQLPAADVLRELLAMGSKGMGGPVEMEFAMRLDDIPELYIVQIRPLSPRHGPGGMDVDMTDRENLLLASRHALGNGSVPGMRDVIMIRPDDFDNTRTLDMARDIGALNSGLDAPYMLIGPGRWGTRDRFLGIPVTWDQISGVRAVVELSLENYRVDPSQGTHFFHNMLALGVKYFNIAHGRQDEFVRWDLLDAAEVVDIRGRVRHVRLPWPVDVVVDGRTGVGAAVIRHREEK